MISTSFGMNPIPCFLAALARSPFRFKGLEPGGRGWRISLTISAMHLTRRACASDEAWGSVDERWSEATEEEVGWNCQGGCERQTVSYPRPVSSDA